MGTSPAMTFLEGLAAELKHAPRAIIVSSAHHDTVMTSISSGRFPSTLHDFGGFPDELYAMTYPAPGSPQLANDIATCLTAAGIANQLDGNKGFDHGCWTPLMLAWPKADIPVVQVSISSQASPEWHYDLGLALSDFRKDNVLVIGSGSMTHNLPAYFNGCHSENAPPLDWVSQFSSWIGNALACGDTDAVLHAIESAPTGKINHPTMDHILPLFVAYGAGGIKTVARQIHASTSFGVLSMDAWRFD